MKRRLITALAGAVILGGLLASRVAASGDVTSCGTSGHAVTAFEFSGYVSDQLHCVIFPGGTTQSSVSDLHFTYYGESGNDGNGVCNGQGVLSHWTWNDCISSFKITTNCHYPVRLYADANYQSLLYYSDGTLFKSSLSFGYDDAVSSVKIDHLTVCPGEPAP
jgi:hypothetical protein